MTKEELKTLEEMTGLVSEKELQQQADVVNNHELDKYVGQFAKVGDNYGLVDGVYKDSLGFVHSDGTSWTSQLVDPKKVRVTKDKKARRSAVLYFENEKESLEHRRAKKYKCDDPAFIEARIEEMASWLERLQG